MEVTMRRQIYLLIFSSVISVSVGFVWGRQAPSHPPAIAAVGIAQAAPSDWCFFSRHSRYDTYWGNYYTLIVYTDQYVSASYPRVPYDCERID